MIHRIFRVQSFRITAPYTLAVEFDDGMERTINLEPVLSGELTGRCAI